MLLLLILYYIYLIIKAAATLRTLGYLHNAMIVNKLPVRPVIIINIAITAANVLNGLENLWINIISCFNKIDEFIELYFIDYTYIIIIIDMNYMIYFIIIKENMNIKENKWVYK